MIQQNGITCSLKMPKISSASCAFPTHGITSSHESSFPAIVWASLFLESMRPSSRFQSIWSFLPTRISQLWRDCEMIQTESHAQNESPSLHEHLHALQTGNSCGCQEISSKKGGIRRRNCEGRHQEAGRAWEGRTRKLLGNVFDFVFCFCWLFLEH